MHVGMVGLGKMGGNMAGACCAAATTSSANRTARPRAGSSAGAPGPSRRLAGLVAALPAPRAIWVMVPAGETARRCSTTLRPLLGRGDVLVDGGNSFYKDSIRRATMLRRARACASSTAGRRAACGA